MNIEEKTLKNLQNIFLFFRLFSINKRREERGVIPFFSPINENLKYRSFFGFVVCFIQRLDFGAVDS